MPSLFKEFTFEAAHRLPLVDPSHKCYRLHGHSWRVEVHVTGPIGPNGFVLDFAEIKQTVNPLIDSLDHQYLNEIPGLANPTSEVVARWFWERLQGSLPMLDCIVVRETCTSGCMYRG